MFFFSSRRRHTRWPRDWSSDVCSSDLALVVTRQCPCGSEGTWLCPGCAAQLAAAPLRVESCCEALQHLSAARVLPQGPLLPAGVDHTPLLPVLALGEYAGDLQRLILRSEEHTSELQSRGHL